jgi:membrane protein YdbS with pleckstrin-like domain
MLGSTLGSAPGVAVVFLLRSESPWSAAGIGVILVLVIAVYLATLRYAGRRFELRRHVIAERLA